MARKDYFSELKSRMTDMY